jgi:hypothetical protein
VTEDSPQPAPALSTDAPAVAQIQLNGGSATVSYDSRKWGKLEKDKKGIISLDRLNGDGYAAIIAERVGVPTGVAIEDLLEELRTLHPDLAVLSRETRTVSGHEVCCLKYSTRVKDLDMIVYAYCFGGLAGTLQIRTCTTAATFNECEPDFTELLNGLEIRPSTYPRLVRMRQGFGFAAMVTMMAIPALSFGLFRFLLNTDWHTALLLAAGLTVGFFLFIWIYDLVKYKLD